MLAATLAGIPCITHERGINYKVSRITKMLASRLHGVLCISEAVREAVAQSGVSGVPLYVIYNGLDPSKIKTCCLPDEFRRQHGILQGRRLIGMVGNVREWKGQEVVIQALPEIVRRHPDVLCLFVGDISPVDVKYEGRLRKLVDNLGLQDHVIFTGYCRNVADALNVMDIAIHASIMPEPFGRVLLEAMAMRKPVIASRDGAVPEIVVEGVTGYTFKPGDFAELAKRVVCLLESRDMLKAFGEAGYRHLINDFHVKQNVARTVEIYERILVHGVPNACSK
jgi:glycosyltransferase involved in cell wall biosynthesis